MEKSIEIEALVFRRMLNHLRERTDVQNIDLMNTAGFCRNCLSNWYEEESNKMEIPVDREEAREFIYGMSYSEWKDKYQK